VGSFHHSRGSETYISVAYGNRSTQAVTALQDGAAQAESSGARSQLVQSLANDSRFAAGLEQARQALASGNRIDAIRLARQVTGMGLREAHDLIDSWNREL